MPMYVRIPTKGFNGYAEWRPGVKIAREEHERLLGEFAHKMADIMAAQVVEAINRQKFLYRWKPLSVSYLTYKKKHNMSLDIWEATGFLKDHIVAYRSNDAYVVGVSKRVRYPKTRLEAWKVMFWMEFGTKKMPARPLFRPIAQNLQKSVRKYWMDFLKEKKIDPSMYRRG